MAILALAGVSAGQRLAGGWRLSMAASGSHRAQPRRSYDHRLAWRRSWRHIWRAILSGGRGLRRIA